LQAPFLLNNIKRYYYFTVDFPPVFYYLYIEHTCSGTIKGEQQAEPSDFSMVITTVKGK